MAESKPPSKARFLLMLALAAAVPILLLLLVSYLQGRATGRRFGARLEAIRKAGEPVTMEELAATCPEPPPGRNAADAYQRAFREMEARCDFALEKDLPVVGIADFPELGAAVPPEVLEKARAYLDRHQETFRLLAAAAALDECRFDLDFSLGYEMPLDHVSKMRQATRLLSLCALERTESGKGEEAAAASRIILRLARALGQEPFLISTLVRTGLDAIAFRTIERWASRACPLPPTLARVEAALRDESDPKMLGRPLLAERCMFLDAAEKGFGAELTKHGTLAHRLGVERGALADLLKMVPFPYRCTDAEQLYFLDYVAGYLEAARKPYPESLIVGAALRWKPAPERYLAVTAVAPGFDSFFSAVQWHMARIESARMALAVLRYRVASKKLPDALGDLAPGFVASVPLDPYDGKPLRYRKEADGFVVYSVSKNGVDDAGVIETKKGSDPPDVGFRVRWPKGHF